MQTLKRMAWAAAVAAAAASPSFAQQPGGGGAPGGTTATTSQFPTTTTAQPTTTSGTAGTQAPGSSGTAGGTGDSIGGTQLTPIQTAPIITPPSQSLATSAVHASNFFGPTAGNPYYQGILANARGYAPPGGFGAALYSATTTGAGGRAGATGVTAARGGTNLSNVGGVLVQMPRTIAYPAQVRFATAPVAPTQMAADLRGTIDRTPTSMLANPAGVQVLIDGNNVTLRGAVQDGDEARLVEGMVRLTPGVGFIRNELAYPRQ